ncbi:MAG TPA: hypothetical protein VGL81_18005 [Polyangiaceae bacterium]
MTEDNRRKNVAAEVRRGDESLESAELLLAAGKGRRRRSPALAPS